MSAKFSRLIGKAGSSKGKRIQLKKDTMLLGAGRSCSIRLKGDYVSDEHAVIRKRVDEKWIIENKSEYGLLVNAERVEARVLTHGDTIQVGATNLLEFEDVAQLVQQESKAAKSKYSLNALNPKSPKQLGAFAALVAYLLVMVFLLTDRLGGNGQGLQALDVSMFPRVIEATTQYATSGKVNTEGVTAALGENTPSYLFFYLAVLSASGEAASGEDVERVTDELSERLEALLLDAYQYQQARQYARAIEVLNRIYLLVPDPRAPVTRYTLSAMSAIKSEAKRG